MLQTPSRAPAPPVGDDGGAFSAPLFRSLLDSMQAGGRWVVMDLGAACPATITLLSEFRCRLDIVDLADGLSELEGATERHTLREAAEALLPSPGQEPTDIVLCWDLLNYLSPAALTAVMGCVASRGRQGALAHALIAYSASTMPSRPGRYQPLADGRLAHTPGAGAQRAAPRYTPDDLARYMRDYTVERGRLLKNGMQEFLLRL